MQEVWQHLIRDATLMIYPTLTEQLSC